MPREPWQRNLALIWLCQLIAIMGAGLVYPFLPFYLEDLGVKGKGEIALWTGVLGAATGVALFFFSPLWGKLADRGGRKRMLMRTYYAGVVVMALQGFATSPWHLLVMRLLQGVFMGSTATATAMVAAGTPRARLGQAMGYMTMASFVAQVGGPMLGGFLGAVVGLRQAFFVTGALYLAAAIGVTLFVRDIDNPDAAVAAPRRGSGDRRLLASPGILLMLAVLFFVYCAPSLSRPVIPLVIKGFDEAAGSGQAGLVFSATALLSASAALIAGRFSGRIGFQRMLVMALIGAGCSYLPIVRVNSLTGLIVLMACVGLFSGGLLPSCNALLGSFSPPERQGAVFGLAGSAQALSMAIGPFSGGLLASLVSIRAGFAVSGVTLIAAGVLVSMMVREPAGTPLVEEPAPAATEQPAASPAGAA